MNRRRFLRVSGGGFAIASAGLAGCLGSDDDERPRRKAVVFDDDVELEGKRMTIELASQPEVQSTKDNVDTTAGMLVPTNLLPVGTVRAGSRSSGSSSGSSTSGATGRGSGGDSKAPTNGRTGWAIYGGHHHHHGNGNDHDREEEATMYRASIATLGVAYVGSNAEYQRESPGPNWGENEWDERLSDPEPGTTLEVNLAALSSGDGSAVSVASESDAGTDDETGSGNESDDDRDADDALDDGTATGNGTAANASNETGDDGTDSSADFESATVDEGWYRVGVELESLSGDTSFGREAADFLLERNAGELSIDEKWHVRPRL